MGNKNKLELSREYCNYLENLPETGMGYQIVDLKLKNGKKLIKRKVFNSTFLELEYEDEIKNEDIKEIKLVDN